MTGAMSSALRLLAVVVAGALALAIVAPAAQRRAEAGSGLTTQDGDTST